MIHQSKTKKFINLVIVFFVISFFVFPCLFSVNATADGGSYYGDPDMDYWGLIEEDMQYAYIEYENGYEDLLLSVNLNEFDGTEAVWIFPVPADPEKCEIDIMKYFPRLSGSNVNDEAEDNINDGYIMGNIGTISPFPFCGVLYFIMVGGMGGTSGGVDVYQHVEYSGFTAELLKANNSEAIDEYMEDKNVSLPSSSLDIINDYIGSNYSFVVSWISDVDEFKEKAKIEDYYYYDDEEHYQISISIRFPTEKMYFPLKLTSIYGYDVIPIRIYTKGYSKPILYSNIENDVEVDNYYSRSFGKYSKISIDTKSSNFKEDLWIEKNHDLGLGIAEFFSIDHSYLILFSFITGIINFITYLIVLRNYVSDDERDMLENISNGFIGFLLGLPLFLLGIIGIILNCYIIKKFSKSFKKKEQLYESRGSMVGEYLLVFLVLFFTIQFAISQILLWII